MDFTTTEMLEALKKKGSTTCALIAEEILSGRSTAEDQLARNHGSFINAVLRGDYSAALRLASGDNKEALKAPVPAPKFNKK